MKVCGLWVAVFTLIFLNGVYSEPSNELINKPARTFHKVVVKRTPVSRPPTHKEHTPATVGVKPAAEGPKPAAEDPEPAAEGPKPAVEESNTAAQSPRLSRSAGIPGWQKSDSDDYASAASAPSQPALADRLPAWLQGIFKIPAQALSDSSYSNIQRPDWVKGTVRLNVPVAADADGQLSPVLLLPVPVPVKGYSLGKQQTSQLSYDFASGGGERQPQPPSRPPAAYYDSYDEAAPAPLPKPSRPQATLPDKFRIDQIYAIPPVSQPASRPDKISISDVYAIPPASQPASRPDKISISDVYAIPPASQPASRPDKFSPSEVYAIPPAQQPAPQQGTYLNTEVYTIRPTQERESQRPIQPPPTPSSELLELFRAQQPTAPHLPPIVTREWRPETEKVVRPVPEPLPGASGNVVVQAVELPAPSAENGRARTKSFAGYSPAPPKELLKEPAPLRFYRPLVVRGEVTVPRADYTEAYTARWDPASGAATMVLHQGTASTHRMVTGEGQVKRVLRKVDRTGEQPMHRCIVIPQSTLTPTDKIPPFLPDTKGFGFKGYVQYGDVKAELWKQSMTGAPGELGGARGEALTYRHELLVSRAQGGVPMPLMYSVAVDSSVLGRDCDGHVHRFFEAREEQHEPDHFTIDLAKSCDATEQTNDMAKVEPLREFTMLQRDPGFEDKFNEYKAKYERKYADDVEEAVRKNVLLQTRRFVSSGNRVGATFSVGTNYLSDWLNKERHQLLGALPDAGGSEQFPYARQQLYAMERKLPAEFDWRERGAVTPVRFQDACSSCWAFAVTGAVEGALFRRTRRLVPLSEKCLVDCAKPYGGQGCRGTQPSRAYNYIRAEGLPARDEYTPYKPKVEQCVARRVTPVTRISAFVNVTHDSVPALKVAIRRHVPTVVIIDGTYQSLASYKAGVYEDNRCSRESRNHAVLAVGYGGTAEEPHFILKNSWAASWGEGGYVRMYGPTNTCGVLNQPSYPRLEPEDVVRVPAEAPPTAA